MSGRRFQPDALSALGTRIFAALGAPEDIARIVATSLVDANLTGHDSHGVLRIPQYAQRIREGLVRPAARPRLVEGRQAIGLVSGEWGFGQLAGGLATDEAVRRAREFGIGAVGTVRCNHFGRMGEYMERAAEQGCVASVWVGGLGQRAAVPHGGRRPTLGTNPIAVGFPVAGEHPVVVDFATTAVAAGKIMVARAAHKPLPPGSIVDRDGHPTTNVADYYAGGALLPAAAHKGFGLSVAAELLGQALTGADAISDAPGKEPVHNHSGALFLAIDAGSMRPAEQAKAQARRIVDRIRAIPPADGFDRVRTPGQPEVESRRDRGTAGFEIPDDTWRAIVDCARSVGLRDEDLPAQIGTKAR
jgi:LDH2 family malate/lactate/ureidoglycolate dehydrogenase